MSVPPLESQPPYPTMSSHFVDHMPTRSERTNIPQRCSLPREIGSLSLSTFLNSFEPADFGLKNPVADEPPAVEEKKKKGFALVNLLSKKNTDISKKPPAPVVPMDPTIAQPRTTKAGSVHFAIQIPYDAFPQTLPSNLPPTPTSEADIDVRLQTSVVNSIHSKDSRDLKEKLFISSIVKYRPSENRQPIDTGIHRSSVDVASERRTITPHNSALLDGALPAEPPWEGPVNPGAEKFVISHKLRSEFDACSATFSDGSPPLRPSHMSIGSVADSIRDNGSAKRLSTGSSVDRNTSLRNSGHVTYSTMPRISRSDSLGKVCSKSPSVSQRNSLVGSSSEEVRGVGLEQTGRETESPKRSVSNPSRKLPRPGPPPNRGLPSLPEGLGDALGATTTSNVVIIPSVLPVLGPKAAKSTENLTLANVMKPPVVSKDIEEEDTADSTQVPLNFRKQRQASVKAKKLRDLTELKQRREKRFSDSSADMKPLEKVKVYSSRNTSSKSASSGTSKPRNPRSSARAAKGVAKPTPTIQFSTTIMTVAEQAPEEPEDELRSPGSISSSAGLSRSSAGESEHDARLARLEQGIIDIRALVISQNSPSKNNRSIRSRSSQYELSTLEFRRHGPQFSQDSFSSEADFNDRNRRCL